MKQTFTLKSFTDAFEGCSNFTTQGLKVIFDFIEEREDETGEEREFSPMYIRNNFIEYKSIQDFLDKHGHHNIDCVLPIPGTAGFIVEDYV